jgi:hypothetical protein
MIANGFPPLHPNLYTKSGPNGQSRLALSSSQLEALKTTIWGILEEFRRKVEINQRLMQRVTESDKNTLELSFKANASKTQQDTVFDILKTNRSKRLQRVEHLMIWH